MIRHFKMIKIFAEPQSQRSSDFNMPNSVSRSRYIIRLQSLFDSVHHCYLYDFTSFSALFLFFTCFISFPFFPTTSHVNTEVFCFFLFFLLLSHASTSNEYCTCMSQLPVAHFHVSLHYYHRHHQCLPTMLAERHIHHRHCRRPSPSLSPSSHHPMN